MPGLPAQDGGGAGAKRGGDVTDNWNIEAVLLDMDGTLLDTERVYIESLIAALGTCGYTDGVVALCHSMAGLPGPECRSILRERYGESLPFPEISRAYTAKRDEMLEAGLPLKNGAIELLDALQAAEYPMAIVTSSSRRTADEHLTLAGIRARFGNVLTLDDVTRGKPSPDLYLLAASRLDLRPQLCLAVEDSSPGVTAAHAAGAITIMVPDTVPPTDETRAKCAAVLPDLKAVLAALQNQGTLQRRRKPAEE